MRGNEVNRVFFIGIGGIGMSALARFFHSHGVAVSGYDRSRTELTDRLSLEGIHVTYSDDVDDLDRNAQLVIFTPAIPSEHPQLKWYRENGYQVEKRARVLGSIVNEMRTIAVAGSHGKTTTACILTNVMQAGNWDTAAFLGGISVNLDSNYLYGNTYAVAEADEFDRSFHQLKPEAAVITSIDTDHLDVYGSLSAIEEAFRTFSGNISATGCLLVNGSVDPSKLDPACELKTYSINDPKADFRLGKLNVKAGRYWFDITHPSGSIKDVDFSIGGRHNVENALGAAAVALEMGMDEESIRKGLSSFRGVKRRFERIYESPAHVYIDDYAHHPNEIAPVIRAARELYPGHRLTVIFQPHLYSRTRDLADAFAESLSAADEVVLTTLYPAREKTIPGITEASIFDLMAHDHKQIVEKEELPAFVKSSRPEVLITMGAGDIDKMVDPIRREFMNMERK